MDLNKSVSWKVALPIGIVLAFLFRGGIIGLVGDIMVIFGIIDLFRQIFKKKNIKQ